MAFAIEFASDVRDHLKALTMRERSEALEAIERHLLHEPLVETRNRNPLRPNPVAPWELRVGRLRVFYEVVPGEPGVVRILAVGKTLSLDEMKEAVLPRRMANKALQPAAHKLAAAERQIAAMGHSGPGCAACWKPDNRSGHLSLLPSGPESSESSQTRPLR